MAAWEDTFTGWAKGPSKTEQEKCENAELSVRKAIASHSRLSTLDITVFPQGSYRNRTNVRNDSDVDICVRLNSCFFEDYPVGTTRADFGNIPATLNYGDYKNLVQEALESYFGKKSVTRGNKAFKIRANTYRVDADAVAAWEHRRYIRRSDGSHYYLSGIEFRTDTGASVTNWPEQNYANSLAKHDATGQRYRKIVRVIKRLRNLMQEENIVEANNIASCLIEALLWNVPNDGYGHASYTDDVRYVLANAFNRTRKDEDCSEWGEVNELKYLFRPSQPWTRAQANAFLDAAWKRIGFN